MSQGIGALTALGVTRATLAYDQNEDRISLTCALEKEECVVLWLTARLANQLVPHLCQAAAQLTDAPSVNDDQKVIGLGALASVEGLENEPATLADTAQERAPELPVTAGADSDTWVVTAIDLTNGPMLVQLGFRDDQGQAPVLFCLEHTCWLSGLRGLRCYAQAGWSMDGMYCRHRSAVGDASSRGANGRLSHA